VVLRPEVDRHAAGPPGAVRPDVPRARGVPRAAGRLREASRFEARPPAAPRGARGLLQEAAAGAVVVSRASLPEAAAGPPV